MRYGRVDGSNEPRRRDRSHASRLGNWVSSGVRFPGVHGRKIIFDQLCGAFSSSLIGGSLSNPQEQYPKWFGGLFWREYPYFLPCVAPSCLAFFSLIITLCFLKEVKLLDTNNSCASDGDVLPRPIQGMAHLLYQMTHFQTHRNLHPCAKS